MFQELHQKTVELLTAKASNYLFAEVESDPFLPSSSPNDFNQHLFNAILDQEENINDVERDERIQSLTKCMEKLQTLQKQHDKCAANLRNLRDTYSAVADKTSSLHTACDQMMSQQTQLAAANEQLKTNIYHYQQYDWIMKKLQTSKLSLTGTLFTQILSTIHKCIEYLKAHSDEKEAQAYLQKYEHCLSKSLTAIKAGVLADLEACREEVFYRNARHSQHALISPTTTTVNALPDAMMAQTAHDERNPVSVYVNDDTFALYYGVFGVKANTVRNALAQAHRFFADTPEYEAMMSDCEAEYFAIRERLLRPIVDATICALTLRNANSSCNFARDGCAFLLRLCDDEFRLYKNFFLIGLGERNGSAAADSDPTRSGMQSAGVRTQMTPFLLEAFFWRDTHQSQPVSLPFDTFMEGLCTILYDKLRPLIISNPHLETLTQLCVLIKVEMIEDCCGQLLPSAANASTMMGTTGMAAEFAMNPRAGFARVMGELVGDIVERIVYRTSLFAQSDVLGYCPAAGDLLYPERLLMMNDIKEHQLAPSQPLLPPSLVTAESATIGKKRSVSSFTAQSSAIDLHCLWYPTVRRTVMCLSKLYKCLDPTVFLSVSSELLEACCQSLELAASKIRVQPIDSAKASVKGAGRMLDAKLFIVKHLLILREQTSPYRSLATKQFRKQQQTIGCGVDAGRLGRLSRSGSITSLASQNDQPQAVPAVERPQQHFDYSLDLSRYKNSMFELLSAENRGRWFELSSNNAVLSFLLATPIHMSECQMDSRRIIETHLRHHCHELIRSVTKFLTGPLADVVAKIEQFKAQVDSEQKIADQSAEKTAAGAVIRQRTLDFTGFEELAPKALNDLTAMAFKTIKQCWPMIRSAFALYIGSRETEEILLQPNRQAIAQLFAAVSAFTQTHFSHEQRQIASVPEQEQIWLLLNSGGGATASGGGTIDNTSNVPTTPPIKVSHPDANQPSV